MEKPEVHIAKSKKPLCKRTILYNPNCMRFWKRWNQRQWKGWWLPEVRGTGRKWMDGGSGEDFQGVKFSVMLSWWIHDIMHLWNIQTLYNVKSEFKCKPPTLVNNNISTLVHNCDKWISLMQAVSDGGYCEGHGGEGSVYMRTFCA